MRYPGCWGARLPSQPSVPNVPEPTAQLSPRGFRAPLNREFVPPDPSGAEAVRKLFPVEQREVFEREADALERAAGPGVPRLLSTGIDPETQRPFLELEWVGQEDLRMRVARAGPMTARDVATFGRDAATILERLHSIGIVHGDIKPANFVATDTPGTGTPGTGRDSIYLIDFEHAASTKDSGEFSEGFTGGTHGYAPPEAYLGRPRTIAFDLFGLGATLHYLLTGLVPPMHSDGTTDLHVLDRVRPTLPPPLHRTIVDLLETDPSARPSAAELRAALAQCPDGDDDLDRALLEGAPYDSTDHASSIARRQHWRRKLEAVLSSIPTTPASAAPREIIAGALRFCRAMHLCMTFVPQMPLARERLGRAQQRLPELLEALPGKVQQLRQRMELTEARHLAGLSVELCRVVSLLNIWDRSAPHLIESTGYILQSALKQLDVEDLRLRATLVELQQAESRLDLDGAATILTELFQRFSGQSRQTARVRDRHHRFVWLLERIAAARDAVAEAVRLSKRQSSAMLDMVERINQALATEPEQTHRSLALVARLLSELPDVCPKFDVTTASRELASLRLELSERATTLVEQMAKRLQLDPVPLRVLLKELGEVDRILLLDCLIDTPHIGRTELLDRLDRLRLQIEQVTAQNRQIAAGARQQIEQGRLTTALFDLERALKASSPDDDSGSELRREMEEVQRLREEIRNASRRNLELAELHARLVDDPNSTLADRQQALAQREEVLTYLIEKGPKAFTARYRKELEELQVARVGDLAADAERCFANESTVSGRVEISRDLLTRIGAAAADPDSGARLQPIVRHWESLYETVGNDLAQQRLEAEQAKRRVVLVRATIAGLLLAAIVTAVLLTT